MDPGLLFAVGSLALIPLLALTNSAFRKRQRNRLVEIGRKLGIPPVEMRWWVPTEIAGIVDDFHWRVTWQSGSRNSPPHVKVQVTGPFAKVEFGPERWAIFGSRDDVQLGDSEIDDAVRFDGSETTLRAIFDTPARMRLLRLVKDKGARLENGALSMRFPFRDRWGELELLLLDLRALVAALHDRPRAEHIAALARIAASGDEMPEVRRNALESLAHAAPSDPAALRAFAASETDASAMVRIAGLLALGKTAEASALAGQADAHADAAIARALGRRSGGDSAESTLLALLASKDEAVQIAAAQSLGRVGSRDAVEPLRAHTGGLLHADLRAAAETAIARIQSRLKGAEAGQLTVAETESERGALSVANAAMRATKR